MGTLSGKTLVVGAGGVSHAAVHKMAMNSDIFHRDHSGQPHEIEMRRHRSSR